MRALIGIKKDRLSFVLDAGERYGDITQFSMGKKKVFLLRHPSHIRYVLSENPENYRKGMGIEEARPLLGYGLLSSDGEVWTRQRRLLQAAFHGDRLDVYQRTIVQAAQKTRSRWKNGKTVDAAREMTLLTVSIVGSALLGVDLEEEAGEIADDLHTLTKHAMARMSAVIPLPSGFPSVANLRARAALRRMEDRVERMVDQRRATSINGGNLLSTLVNRQETHGGWRQVRDEIMTALVAGHETTAAALSWVWRLLSTHPEAAGRLRAELDSVVGVREPALADLPKLTYTRAVIEEALRLYPPVWLLPRKSLAADTIGGYHIPAGSEVLLCLYAMHRHPKFWTGPERFAPERFLRDRKDGSMQAYLPFGAGPRTCIGSRLGLMEAMLILAVMAPGIRLEAVAGHVVEAEASLSLHAKHGVPVNIREAAPVAAGAFG